MTAEEQVPDRRLPGRLSDEEFERVAARAADLVKEEFYAAVGKGVVSKILYIAGASLIALAAWMHGKGKISLAIFGGD